MRIRTAAALLIVGSLAALAGCMSSTDPVAQFSATPATLRGRAPLLCTFDASGSYSPNGAITAYIWDFGDNRSGAGVSVSHTYDEKGTYSVLLTVTDATGKSGHVSRSVQALGYPPTASFTHSVETNSGVPIEFDASASSDPDGQIVEWVWSFGDGEISEGEIVLHTYSDVHENKTYSVTLTVKDDDGDTGSVSHKVTVYGCNCGG